MSYIGKEAFEFMADLYRNNNKAWFDAHRKRYEQQVRDPMKALAGALDDPVSFILPEFSGKAKVSRINNNVRFSPNKPLYKERVWISFGGSTIRCANLFAGIDRNGWTTGAGIADSKPESLDNWRNNLLNYSDVWRRYGDAIGLSGKALVHLENPYRKPLFPDIPDELYELVQARGVWIVESYRTVFDRSPVGDFFRGICRFLPAYLFMTIAPSKLLKRLGALGKTIIAPDREIAKIWDGLLQ